MAKPQNPPRKHHYVPVFYLEQWTGGPKRELCEYKRVRPGKVVPRRTSPDGTGYKIDLYRIEGLPDPASQVLEQKFMHLVDTQAVHALQRLVRQEKIVWDNKLRSAWVRFILSLVYRNPEVVSLVKEHMRAMWGATLEHARGNYEDALSRRSTHLRRIPSSDGYGGAIQGCGEFDPGCNRQFERGARNSKHDVEQHCSRRRTVPAVDVRSTGRHAVRIGRAARLYRIAYRTQDAIHRFSRRWLPPACWYVRSDHDLREINRIVVEQAREFVWGTDDTQLSPTFATDPRFQGFSRAAAKVSD